jgi:hypothetical protein
MNQVSDNERYSVHLWAICSAIADEIRILAASDRRGCTPAVPAAIKNGKPANAHTRAIIFRETLISPLCNKVRMKICTAVEITTRMH